jgi:CBS domain-containing protein
MKVQEIMSTPVRCLRQEDDLAHARRTMLAQGVTHLPVVDEDGRLLGMVAASDWLFGVDYNQPPARRRVVTNAPVTGIMTKRVAVLGPQMPVEDALDMMVEHRFSAAPVVHDDRVLGLVSAQDLLGEAGKALRGSARVRDLMRPRMTTVHRHASLPAVLDAMRREGVRVVAVVEGQAAVVETRPVGRQDLRDPVHRGVGADEFGVVGLIDLRSLLGASWFDPVPVFEGKALKEARRTEHAGPKRLRHVEVVDVVAEDVMVRKVRGLRPEDDAGVAADFVAQSGYAGLPVLGPGLDAPAYLDRLDLLEASLAHVPAR